MAGHEQSSSLEYNVPSQKNKIWELPGLYVRAIFHPTDSFFAREAERATWGLIWFQILLLIVIPLVFGAIRGLDPTLAARVRTHSGFFYDILVSLSLGASYISNILRPITVPLFFFVTVTIQFLLAKAFRGVGHFRGQAHTMLLYQVPLAFLGGLISMAIVWIHTIDLRSVTPLVNLLLLLYGIFLNFLVIKDVHRLSQGKAIAIIVLCYIVMALLIAGLLFLLASMIVSLFRKIVS